MSIPKRKRKTEDYARLISISMLLGFKDIVLSILADAGSRTAEVIDYIDGVKNDLPKIEYWMDDFIKKIPLPDFQRLTAGFWEEQKRNIDKENFNLKQLF